MNINNNKTPFRCLAMKITIMVFQSCILTLFDFESIFQNYDTILKIFNQLKLLFLFLHSIFLTHHQLQADTHDNLHLQRSKSLDKQERLCNWQHLSVIIVFGS